MAKLTAATKRYLARLHERDMARLAEMEAARIARREAIAARLAALGIELDGPEPGNG